MSFRLRHWAADHNNARKRPTMHKRPLQMDSGGWVAVRQILQRMNCVYKEHGVKLCQGFPWSLRMGSTAGG